VRLLLISNGSGEDRIAAEIASCWRVQAPETEIQALALVGTGTAYTEAGIASLPPRFSPPSAGFAYLNPRLLWHDLGAGLLPHLIQSWRCLREHPADQVIAVGDLVPLLASLALPQAKKAFVACALSEYYLGESLKPGRSVFDPLQRQVLKQSGMVVFARDALSAQSLQRFGIKAHFVGNLMLDCVGEPGPPLPNPDRPTIGLLPGSHADAPANFGLMLQQLAATYQSPLHFVLLQAPQLETKVLAQSLLERGWQQDGACWHLQQARLSCWPARHYQTLLQQAALVVGLAGTANEQAVGHGVPVLSFASRQAQQYTWRFGEAQQRLLGAGLCFVGDPHPELISWQLQRMLNEPAYRQAAKKMASSRFGLPGGVKRLVMELNTTSTQ